VIIPKSTGIAERARTMSLIAKVSRNNFVEVLGRLKFRERFGYLI